MTVERLIKRTIWQTKCKCGEWEDTRESNPPREKQCPKSGKKKKLEIN